jgi:hypothetical protein
MSGSTTIDMADYSGRSVGFLMQAAMLGAAVERRTAHEAFAARQMHAALRTSHHVLAACGRLPLSALDFPFVTFQYPVGKREAR